jgi:phosphoglycolate phosphatase-like HAD superfamily hydrolase
MNGSDMTRLVLWDIDHTLISMRGAGRDLFAEAFEQTTGVRMTRQAAVDGMTDPVIFRETAALHGITTTRADFDRFAIALGSQHLSRTAEIRERGHALPGAASALAALAGMPEVLQTVVTGNIRASAEVKLRVFGLDAPMAWDIGAYGEESDTRSELVRTALHRASARTPGPLATDRIALIGDTPADVAGALANNIRVIGVASGRSSEEALQAAGATLTLPDLTDAEVVTKVVMAENLTA